MEKDLEDSDLFKSAPEVAQELWNKGYRPMQAEDLREGKRIAYRMELHGIPTASTGEARLLKVHVSKKHPVVMVRHTEGDEMLRKEAEVWSQ